MRLIYTYLMFKLFFFLSNINLFQHLIIRSSENRECSIQLQKLAMCMYIFWLVCMYKIKLNDLYLPYGIVSFTGSFVLIYLRYFHSIDFK